jgi:hypothetical protein
VTEMRYSSNTYCARSIKLQRTTPMDRGGPTDLDHRDARAPFVIELRGMPGPLIVDAAIGSAETELRNPITSALEPHASKSSCLPREPPS